MITLRGLPLRRPVVVSRKAPHFPGRGGHSPLRLLVIRTNSRCTCQKVTTNHRGGTRALPPAMPAPPLADHLTIALSASGAQQDSTLRGSLADHAEEPGEESEGYGSRRGLVHGAGEEQVELRAPEQPGARRSGVTDQLGTSPPSIRMAKSTSSAAVRSGTSPISRRYMRTGSEVTLVACPASGGRPAARSVNAGRFFGECRRNRCLFSAPGRKNQTVSPSLPAQGSI